LFRYQIFRNGGNYEIAFIKKIKQK